MTQDEETSFSAIAAKWQKRWADEKVFEPVVDTTKPKFFCNFPYPYVNAYPHIGHLYTIMRVDAFARYKRLKGFNVLFPQGWHATGSPILNAAKRIAQKEPTQWKIMQDQGFSDTDIVKFEEPKYWLEFFAPEFKKELQSMGLSVDWSREFHTTSLNPHYDKFIRWQFLKLKEKGLVIKGKFPVVWDPKMHCAVGDHDRMQGEGETPQEFMLTKHKLADGRFVVTATLRPDTILGITNLYAHPKVTYKEITIQTAHTCTSEGKEAGSETWIVGQSAIMRFEEQGWELKVGKDIAGAELIGQETQEVDGHKVPILPATFIDEHFGTGLVHSVPSDSADDLIALQDLQKDEKTLKSFGLDVARVQAIKPIPVLDTPGYGDVPAQKFLDEYKVTHQNERKKLDEIKSKLYKLSFYSGTYNAAYKSFFSENLQGKKVAQGKDLIKQELAARGWTETFYQLTGKVVARSLNEAIVKIVDDQWFVNYADPAWKKLAHACLEQLTLYPEKSRAQFTYTIDWLREWACTREEGLGTRLPWDEKWLIESLSDSTIYMAYYTIVPYLRELDPALLDEAFFDYIFQGKGAKPNVEHIEQMRASFTYWYPVDFRNSGKDLIQNHLTFFIFSHAALFPKAQWPKGIGVNGWVMVDGQKMSKSLGNMIPVRKMAREFGPDASRVTILFGGEGMDDPNWDSSFAQSIDSKLRAIVELCTQSREESEVTSSLDAWFASQINYLLKKAEGFMEQTLFRSAVQIALFDLPKAARYYIANSEHVNTKLLRAYVQAQLPLLSCFAPHYAEEAWEKIGNTESIAKACWPRVNTGLIDESLHYAQDQRAAIEEDIRRVLTLSKTPQPKKIIMYLALDWKYTLVKTVKTLLETSANPKEVITGVMQEQSLKTQGQQVMKIVPGLLKDRSKLPHHLFSKAEEQKIYAAYIPELAKVFSCEVIIGSADGTPKSEQGMPGKPAIFVE